MVVHEARPRTGTLICRYVSLAGHGDLSVFASRSAFRPVNAVCLDRGTLPNISIARLGGCIDRIAVVLTTGLAVYAFAKSVDCQLSWWPGDAGKQYSSRCSPVRAQDIDPCMRFVHNDRYDSRISWRRVHLP